MWVREQRLRCPTCGTRHDEWEADKYAYVAEARTCPGCEILDQERRNVPDRAEGVQFFLVPRRHAADPG